MLEFLSSTNSNPRLQDPPRHPLEVSNSNTGNIWPDGLTGPLTHISLTMPHVKQCLHQNGKQREFGAIHNTIWDDLSWAINHLSHSNGIHLLKSFQWTPSLANFTIFCDTCPDGMGFWYPDLKDGYYAHPCWHGTQCYLLFWSPLCALCSWTCSIKS